MNAKLIGLVVARDPSCYHCGATDGLQPHHRKNRRAGGSKLLDRPDNLMMVCGIYNGLMESDPDVAAKAREFGHKLRSWDGFEMPVFDQVNQIWWALDENGGRAPAKGFDFLF